MPKMEYRGKMIAVYSGNEGRRYSIGTLGRFVDVHPDDVQTFRQSGKWVLLDSPYPSIRYISEREIDFLQELANMLPPNPLVVNIGAGNGCSSLALMLSRSDLQLVVVDIQKDSSPTGDLESERLTLVRAGVDMTRHRQIHGDSKVVGQNWKDSPVDMVFVDGEHGYEACKGDILAWLPHIKHGGIMPVHDCEQSPGIWPQVFQAVDELLTPKFQKIGHVDNLAAFRIENAPS